MKKKILVVSQYFYPEQFRINDICSEWVKRGYEVTVLTGIPNYPGGNFYEGYGLLKNRSENYNGINIVRIPLFPRGQNKFFLVLNYLSFVLSGFFWALTTHLEADCVFIYEVSPMTQALPGVWYAKRRKIPCYLYVTDLWPENVEIAGGVNNSFVLNSIGRMVDYIYRRCNRIFTSSKSFVEAINARGVPEDKLEFWPQYAEDFYKPVSRDLARAEEIRDDGVFNIIFAGNIGFAQGLDVLPKVGAILKKKKVKVRFNVVGDGRFKETLCEKVKEQGLDEMFNFVAKLPAENIPELMSASDAALISLSKSKVFSITIPAKTQSCLACGIPVLVSADGEIQRVINDAKAGYCSNAGDAEGLAGNIEKMILLSSEERKEMANNAVAYYKENFSKDALLDKMDKWLQKSSVAK